MVSQYIIDTLNLEFIEDYFDLIIEEKTQENKEKAKELFEKLSNSQKTEFFNYVDTAYYYDAHDNGIKAGDLVNYLTL